MKVNLVSKRFISGFHQKKREKWLRLLSDRENKTDPIHLFVFLKKSEKYVQTINSGREHTMKIEGELSSLQLFSCNHEGDSRIALHASKFTANVVVVWKNTDIAMLLINSHSASTISKECVVKYDKNIYANIGTTCKYLRNTVSRNI